MFSLILRVISPVKGKRHRSVSKADLEEAFVDWTEEDVKIALARKEKTIA